MIMTGFRLASVGIRETTDTGVNSAIPEPELSAPAEGHEWKCFPNENILSPPKRLRFLRPKVAGRDDERCHDIASEKRRNRPAAAIVAIRYALNYSDDSPRGSSGCSIRPSNPRSILFSAV
jgi:hypothetical protein